VTKDPGPDHAHVALGKNREEKSRGLRRPVTAVSKTRIPKMRPITKDGGLDLYAVPGKCAEESLIKGRRIEEVCPESQARCNA